MRNELEENEETRGITVKNSRDIKRGDQNRSKEEVDKKIWKKRTKKEIRKG